MALICYFRGMKCQNCHSELLGEYCHQCGQKHVESLEMRFILADSLGYILNYDNSFFRTIGKLLSKPHVLIQEFLKGKRKSYFPPFKMLILTTSILAIILIFLPETPAKFQGADISFNESDEKFATIFKSLIERFFTFTLFLSIPANALFNMWLFKKQSYNYAEHLVISTFIASAVNIFSALTYFAILLPELPQQIFASLFTLVMVVYSAYAYIKVFNQRVIVGILKYFTSTFLTTLFYAGEFLVLGAVYYWWLYL